MSIYVVTWKIMKFILNDSQKSNQGFVQIYKFVEKSIILRCFSCYVLYKGYLVPTFILFRGCLTDKISFCFAIATCV